MVIIITKMTRIIMLIMKLKKNFSYRNNWHNSTALNPNSEVVGSKLGLDDGYPV
jgi:hypothetical protein